MQVSHREHTPAQAAERSDFVQQALGRTARVLFAAGLLFVAVGVATRGGPGYYGLGSLLLGLSLCSFVAVRVIEARRRPPSHEHSASAGGGSGNPASKHG